MKQTSYHQWIKIQRKYRNTQAKWIKNQDTRLARKLDITGRRLHALNRKWSLGIATSVLSAWLAVMPAAEIKAQTFPAAFDLSTLDGSNGFVINGIDGSDESGVSVSAAGDVNGDGVDDLLIGAYNGAPNGNSLAGETYVVFGQTSGFPASLDLSGLDGSNGFLLNGIDVYDRSGHSVSGAGDVNGDGVDDLLIGAHTAAPNGNSHAGETYVVFGQTGGFPASLNLSGLDGSNGFLLNGIDAFDNSGRSVSNAGDLNGDGVDDLLIGAQQGDPNGNTSAGETYVVFGQTGGFPSSLNLSGLNGSNGFVLNGIDTYDFSGRSVSGAGDVNGDGVDDLLIGAQIGDPYGNTNAGKTYVVFGQTGGFPASMDLSDLDGSNGFVLNGIDANDQSGRSVSGAGDVNGDGVDDLLIGAYNGAPNGNSLAGETYVVFGQTSGFPASLDLSGLDGNTGFVMNGIDVNDYSGRSVSGAGDVNGDGVDDLLIGAHRGGNSSAGESYVVFGQTSAFSASLNLSGLDGSNGFVLNGIDTYDFSGRSVSGAGDVNGDGVDDLLIGAHTAGPNGNTDAGETYVVFGIQGPAVPTVANTIPDQQTNEDQVFDFIVPANTFDDINAADVLTLSATLVGGGALPTWLTFTPGTETFSGTPANEDVGTISIEVTATDPGGLFVSDVFDLEVANTNDAPVLASIGAQSGDEGTEITFTASATDVDLPANTLIFSLDATSLGLGMAIDASTGAFSWTPTEAQSGSHDVTVTVSDGLLTDDEIVTITINEINIAPVLAAIGVQSGDEETEITFTASATDVDLPANTLTFSLGATSLGKGMMIDASTGAFSWTPAEGQDGTHDVVVTVSDGTLTDSEIVTITVAGLTLGTKDEVNTSINIYPNPAIGRISVAELPQAHSVTIYSLSGAKVLHSIVKNGFVDISPLQSGTYVVVVKDKAGLTLLLNRLLKTN